MLPSFTKTLPPHLEKVRAHSIGKVQGILKEFQATCTNLESYINKNSTLEIICKCGSFVKLSLPDINSGNSKPRCKTCTSLAKSEAHRKEDFTELLAKFHEYGATPDLSKYISGRHPLPYTCKCGESHTILPMNAGRGNRRIECPFCQAKYAATERSLRGSEHPNWNSLLSDEERSNRVTRFREDKENREWARKVKAEWGFKCAITNTKSKNLASHHLYSYQAHPELRLEVGNGVPILRELHDEFHDQYGRKVTTYPEFCEFFYKHTGRAFQMKDPLC